MKHIISILFVACGVLSAQVNPASVAPACTPTKIVKCTPQVTAAGNYVPAIPLAGTLAYYLQDAASSPTAAYKQALSTTPAVKTQLDFTTQPAGTDALQVWATNAGAPGIAQIPAGNYTWHIHAAKTAGSANRTFTLYAEFWEVNASEVDVAKIGTTESSVVVTGSEAEYTLVFHDNNPYTLATTASRIAIKTFAVVGGSGATLPTVSLYYGGTADSGFFTPSPTVDATNFVPQDVSGNVIIGGTLSVGNTVLDQAYGESTSGPTSGNSLIVVGDSIVLQTTWSWAAKWPSFLTLQTGGRIWLQDVLGATGECTQMAPYVTTAIAEAPAKIVIACGLHDAVDSVSVAVSMAAIDGYVKQLKAKKIEPILSTLTPYTGNYHTQINALNAAITAYASTNKLKLMDPFTVGADPSTQDWKAGYSQDGVHPLPPASRLIATAAATSILGEFSATVPYLPAANGDGLNMLTNGNFTTLSTLPTNWTKNSTDATIIESVTTGAGDVLGNWVNLTGGVGTGGYAYLASDAVTTGFYEQDRIALVGKVKTSGFDGAATSAGWLIRVVFTGTPALLPDGSSSVYIGGGSSFNGDVTGSIYLEFPVPTGATGMSVWLQMNSNPTGVISFGQMGLINLTTNPTYKMPGNTANSVNINGTPCLLGGLCAVQVRPTLLTSTFVPPYLRYLGDGSDGAIDCNGNLNGIKYATTFNVSAGHTCTGNNPNASLVIHATGACTIAGLMLSNGVSGGVGSTITGDGATGGGGGGGAASGTAGIASFNIGTVNYLTGGALGTAGAAGGVGNSVAPNFLRISWEWARGLFLGGTKGGAGGSSGPAGGNGGQAVILQCASINFASTGVIDVSGAQGAPSTANSVGSSGGGGGGYVWLVGRDSLVNAGTIYVQGGPGGQCYPTNLVFSTPNTVTNGGVTSSGTGAYAHVSTLAGGNPTVATVDAAGSGYNYTPNCTVVTTTGGSGATCTAVMAGVAPSMTLSSVTLAGGNGSYGATNTLYTSCGAGGYGALGWSKAALMQ